MNTRNILHIVALLWIACSLWARAWIPAYYPDPELVDRSELIVVAHIVPGTIKFLPYNGTKHGDYSLTLAITSALKGSSPTSKLTVLVHYGLTPIVGGYLKEGDQTIDYRQIAPVDKATIQIFDTNPGMVGGPLTKDASQDNIWFLRRNDPGYQYDAKNDLYGIFNTQDIQPLDLKPYYNAFLSKNTMDELHIIAGRDSPSGQAARMWLEHLNLQQINAISDPALRADRLLPHFLHTDSEPVPPRFLEAERMLIKTGVPAAEKLKPYFQNPHYTAIQPDILQIWSQTRFPFLVPILIGRLEKEEAFWASQTDVDMKAWLAVDPKTNTYSSRTTAQCDSYGRIIESVRLLEPMNAPSARGILTKIHDRWGPFEPQPKNGIRYGIASETAFALDGITRSETAKP